MAARLWGRTREAAGRGPEEKVGLAVGLPFLAERKEASGGQRETQREQGMGSVRPVHSCLGPLREGGLGAQALPPWGQPALHAFSGCLYGCPHASRQGASSGPPSSGLEVLLHFRGSPQEQKQHVGRMSRDRGSTMTNLGLSICWSALVTMLDRGGPSGPTGLCPLGVLPLTPVLQSSEGSWPGLVKPLHRNLGPGGVQAGGGGKTSACSASWALP